MATEQEYDKIIAPMLAEVALKAKELGMSLIARVEWEPGESGITQIGDLSSIGQLMTQLAAHSHGNIDTLCIELMRRVDTSRSIILSVQQRRPSVMSETKNLRVKALGWHASPLRENSHLAPSGFGENYVAYLAEDVWRCVGQDHPTLDEAKAAAQADYERRILGALEPAPKPAGGETREYAEAVKPDGVGPASNDGSECRCECRATPPSADAQDVGELVAALEWYSDLPKEWLVQAGPHVTYGDLRLLGERARSALTVYKRSTTDGQS